MSGRVARGAVVYGYLTALLVLPLAMLLWRTFEGGVATFLDALATPEALHALQLTVVVAAIAVPLNTVFGVAAAIVLVRHRFPGRALLNAAIDLPFALSPVVVGLAILLVVGRQGWLGGTLAELGVRVVFSLPGIVIATLVISLPLVVRQVMPVLEALGQDQERAAATLGASSWQTFRRIRLPRMGAPVTYGVILSTARALGEFGAVTVVSGRIAGQTETLPLHVQARFEAFDMAGAYAAATLLALLAVVVLVAMRLVQPKETLA